MDNLTHSLFGAALGQLGLKKKTGLALPTLIIAANLPDIDAACAVYGVESLSMRRGLTHGPVALVLLPIVLWALMLAFDTLQTRRGTRPAQRTPVDRPWLLALAFIGCTTHPALDWLNNYGVRLFEPFSSRWFYGDTLFIIDVWIWAALGASLWSSIRRERHGARNWQQPAWIGFAAVCAYIFANGLITGSAEKSAESALHATGNRNVLVVASPPPLTFWRRDIFWRTNERHGGGRFVPGFESTLDTMGGPNGMDDPQIVPRARTNKAAQAFLFWARMPVARQDGSAIVLSDQRFDDPLVEKRFGVRLTAPDAAAKPAD